MITLDGLEIAVDSIVDIKNENGLYYVYTSDYLKINITEDEYNELLNK